MDANTGIYLGIFPFSWTLKYERTGNHLELWLGPLTFELWYDR